MIACRESMSSALGHYLAYMGLWTDDFLVIVEHAVFAYFKLQEMWILVRPD